MGRSWLPVFFLRGLHRLRCIVEEEPVIRVLPQAADEFTCGSCFLVATAPSWPAKRTARSTA